MLDFLAAAASGETAPVWITYLPIIGMVLIFWFLLFRPQMKAAKEHREKIASVKRNDQVVTAGGIIGKVTKVEETQVELEIAQGVKVKVVKSTLGDIIKSTGKPAND